jgi:hypothetical protein
MLLKQGKDPRVVWRWAMMSLLAFFILGLLARSVPPTWENTYDGVRGALLGVAIGLVVVAGILKRRRGSTGAT